MSKVAGPLEFTADDFYKCSILNMRSFIFLLCLFFILSSISGLINSFFVDRDSLDDMLLEQIMERKKRRNLPPRFLRNNLMGGGLLVEEYDYPRKFESFSNEEFFSDIDALKQNYSNYQFTRLTAPTDTFGNPENAQTGQAYRLLKPASKGITDDKMKLFLDVYCNLYLLNGNPFGKENVIQKESVEQDYLVYLMNTKTNKRKFINKLERDGDDIYKFKYETTDVKEIEELMSFDKIVIVYKIDSNETDILEGNFLRNI
jgi:hypothetical protein